MTVPVDGRATARPVPLTGALTVAAPIVAAVLYALASPPLDLALLAWLVPGLLVAVAVRVSPTRALASGALFGLVFGCTASAWALPAAVHYFDRGVVFATALVLGVWILFGALPYGLLALATRVVGARVPRPWMPFCAAWLWVAAEWARSSTPVALPWGVLAHSQWRTTPLVQVADLGGMYAVSFVVAFVSVSCIEALVLVARRPAPELRHAVRALAPAALVLFAVLTYGAWRLRDAPSASDATRAITVVQSDVPRETVWQRSHAIRALASYASATRSSAARGDLVVWPESAVAFYPDRDAMMLGQIAAIARSGEMALLFGASRLDADGGARNAVFLLGTDGALRDTYDKQRLVPFGEYIPLRTAAPTDPSSPPTRYVAGHDATPLDTGTLRIAPLVCWEALFPQLAREMVRRGAEVLVNVSNEAWLDGGSGVARAQQFAMAALRAVETRRPLVRAATGGVSGLIDERGVVRDALPSGSGTLRLVVRPGSGLTPYVRFGDTWLAVAGLLVAALVLRGPR